ncbi:hypothetical protein [Sulfuricurvum sp. RIFCSPLOWO2_12_FULL_43_24]|uniref:hypothetical protein n=1 Tax=Sulfuricurvum sp. RIFCSPLOWO2_12_FULL_43_24 TaxID=1802247 RepID=UPI0008B2A6B1|nr:hypothetical protein [Sulfuricurvum sp. RIFCSPLOWO2_12_FULL_43_24]OHD85241.1 MAG: hypothetical protein A2Y52_08180 [Sulfuricurvum sp. RIFCSPLOWO2_02_43_6]OHD85504.1 MAG: hypothetical protein A3I60_06260 [Sulfuricurvum sp. RIFCSPLOWO2_02_FULL_43_45]OHD88435.1 MAG: hypothetical protein A3G19_03205 [Sulfuricurvum sp. RIFCSPLOWO2_12_FULL_43_24]
MLLFGHPYIPSKSFYHIDAIEAIRHTPPNSILSLFFTPENLDIIEHLHQNNIRFALHIETTTDAVIAENLGASYLIVLPRHAEAIQKVAEHYLFDAKILGYLEETKELEDLIDMRLDGAIFSDNLIKITS